MANFAGTSSAETLIGTEWNDTIQGLGGSDSLFGAGGSDYVYGGGQGDAIDGGDGDDALHGGGGADTIFDSSGVNGLYGDDGDDRIIVTSSDMFQTVHGGEGNDYIKITSDYSTVCGDGGADTLRVSGEGVNVFGGAGADTYHLAGADGAVINDFQAGVGGDILKLADLTDCTDIYFVQFAGNTQIYGEDAYGSHLIVTLVGVTASQLTSENLGGMDIPPGMDIFGTAAADTLVGTCGDDDIAGDGGNDSLFGGEGSDYLDGSIGADTMAGGAGGDFYFVDNRKDIVIEGTECDCPDTVASGISYALTDNVENLFLLYDGNSYGYGNSLDNYILGNVGDNNLRGGGGNDVLFGGDGADTLFGQSGADMMVGGDGEDVFLFTNRSDIANAGDLVADFWSGEDQIDVSDIDADSVTGGNQAFTWIGSSFFHRVAGELRVAVYGDPADDTFILQGDVNGDGTADFTLFVGGAVQQYDIIL